MQEVHDQSQDAMQTRLIRLCLLAAILGVLLVTDGVQGVGSSFRGAAIKPSPANTQRTSARREQPQLAGSVGDLVIKHHQQYPDTVLPHHHHHQYPDSALRASTTIIRTTIITVTETTIMDRVATRNITIFTATNTLACNAKTEPQRFNAALADVIVTKPISNKGPVTPPVNYNPIYIPKPAAVVKPVETRPVGVKPVEFKPVENKPVAVKPFEFKPSAVKPFENKPVNTKPLEFKPVVDALSNLSQSFVKPVSMSGSKPVSANLPNTSPVFVHKPNNVNKEFIMLMAEFTSLMEKLSAPKSQARLVGRFRSVTRKDEVWRGGDKEVHHEELTDELRQLVQQIKDVRTKPHDFYEHLETFVSYMEEI